MRKKAMLALGLFATAPQAACRIDRPLASEVSVSPNKVVFKLAEVASSALESDSSERPSPSEEVVIYGHNDEEDRPAEGSEITVDLSCPNDDMLFVSRVGLSPAGDACVPVGDTQLKCILSVRGTASFRVQLKPGADRSEDCVLFAHVGAEAVPHGPSKGRADVRVRRGLPDGVLSIVTGATKDSPPVFEFVPVPGAGTPALACDTLTTCGLRSMAFNVGFNTAGDTNISTAVNVSGPDSGWLSTNSDCTTEAASARIILETEAGAVRSSKGYFCTTAATGDYALTAKLLGDDEVDEQRLDVHVTPYVASTRLLGWSTAPEGGAVTADVGAFDCQQQPVAAGLALFDVVPADGLTFATVEPAGDAIRVTATGFSPEPLDGSPFAEISLRGTTGSCLLFLGGHHDVARLHPSHSRCHALGGQRRRPRAS